MSDLILPTSSGGGNRRGAFLPSMRWCWVGVFLVALATRGGLGTFRLARTADPAALEFDDEIQYWATADGLHRGQGLVDELGFRATRMPLYPAFLSCFVGMDGGVTWAIVVQWLIGAIGAVLAFGAATALFDRRVGALAGLLVAVDPFLVFTSSLLLTETLFVTSAVGLWWTLVPLLRGGNKSMWRWIVVGVTAAWTVYVRESALGLIGMTLLFVVCVNRLERRTLVGAMVALGLIVASLIPWAARNRQVTGDWCWLTTRAGISLYDGVRPGATGASDLGDVKQMAAVRGMSETQWNRYFLDKSFEAIKGDPGRIVRLAGVKFLRMWNPFPNLATHQSTLVRAASFVWMVPLLICVVVAVVWLARSRAAGGWRVTLFLLLPAIYLSVLHSLFIGSVRYRLGAVVMLEMLAAAVAVMIFDRSEDTRCGPGDRS